FIFFISYLRSRSSIILARSQSYVKNPHHCPADSLFSRCDLLQNYFKALTAVESRFQISPDKDHINTVTFMWYDAIKSKLKAS
ncbi:hypothetical protein PJI20_29395, partial [Mycobacterium kansasii]